MIERVDIEDPGDFPDMFSRLKYVADRENGWKRVWLMSSLFMNDVFEWVGNDLMKIGLPVLSILMGIIFKETCSSMTPDWLIVCGSFGLIYYITKLIQDVFASILEKNNFAETIFGVIFFILQLFFVAWFICGNNFFKFYKK